VECVVLPIDNTTTELLATWFAERLCEDFRRRGMPEPRRLRVEVEENFGQSATVEIARGDEAGRHSG
jgi:hypothetical protein